MYWTEIQHKVDFIFNLKNYLNNAAAQDGHCPNWKWNPALYNYNGNTSPLNLNSGYGLQQTSNSYLIFAPCTAPAKCIFFPHIVWNQKYNFAEQINKDSKQSFQFWRCLFESVKDIVQLNFGCCSTAKPVLKSKTLDC